MDITRTYAINNSSIDVRIGDLLDSTCEVVVSSDDCMVSQGGRGIGAQIAEKGGDGIAADARKKTPAELGGVVVTTAGELGQKYVFHAITIDFYKRLKKRAATDEESRDIQVYIVKNSVRRCLRLAAALDVRSIAFPVIGTGAAGIPFEKAVRCMADVFMEELSRTNREMRIELWLYRGFERHEPVDFIPVFEIFAEMRGRAAVAVHDAMPEVADNEHPDSGSSFGNASSDAANEVFISYSRKDLESSALKLVRRVLDGLKMPYWIDVDGNYSGRNYKGVIVQAIRRANLVIFMSSGNSNKSENVVKEVDIAAKAGKTILPVMVDMSPYDDRIAYDLASIDYIDVGKPSAVERLREALLLSRINATNGVSCGRTARKDARDENN